jgi:hypothetical protein
MIRETILTTDNQQFLSMAMAYIEVGKISAAAETELKHEHYFQNAIAYQLFHAIELFYKYMIKAKVERVERTHDLKDLEELYSSFYPGDDYKINHPFDFSDYEVCELNEDESKLVESHLGKFKPKYLDQHLRYPIDERTGGYSFSIDPSTFEDVRKEMLHAAKIEVERMILGEK